MPHSETLFVAKILPATFPTERKYNIPPSWGFPEKKNSSQTENYLRTMISISSALIPQWFPGDGQFVSETFLLKQIKPTRGTIED